MTIPFSVIAILRPGEGAFDTATSTLDTDQAIPFDFALGLLPVAAFTCLGPSQRSPREIHQSTYSLASPPRGTAQSHLGGGDGGLVHSIIDCRIALRISRERSHPRLFMPRLFALSVTVCGEGLLAREFLGAIRFTQHRMERWRGFFEGEEHAGG